MKKGYIQVYTGNGKGKTTAALGLALRAVGAGLKIFIAQFMKGIEYSELHAIERFADSVTLKQFGRNSFIHDIPDQEDIDMAKLGLQESDEAIQSGKYDIVILDEANVAVHFQLFPVQKLLTLMDDKPDQVELVISPSAGHRKSRPGD